MTGKPEDLLIQAWKRQCDGGLRVMETLIEGAMKVHEVQLEAAADAHADAEATRKAIAAATDASQVLKLQTEWARANMEKSLAYWRSMVQSVMETNAELVKHLYSVSAVPAAEQFKGSGLDMVDSAYKQWLDSVRQFYQPLERAGV